MYALCINKAKMISWTITRCWSFAVESDLYWSLLVWSFSQMFSSVSLCWTTRWSQSSRLTAGLICCNPSCTVCIYCILLCISIFYCIIKWLYVLSSRWSKIFKSRIIQTIALYGNTSFMVAIAILIFLLIGTCVSSFLYLRIKFSYCSCINLNNIIIIIIM